MKSKTLFWILAILVFGLILAAGFLYIHNNLRMFILIEGIGILAIIFFIILYRQLIKPYQIISQGMELLKEQDFSTRLRPVSNSEANKLIGIFNKMMDQLKEERLLVREKNHFLDLLIQASPQGVILLDFDDRITDINASGMKLLDIQNLESVVGRTLAELDNDITKLLINLKQGEDVIVRVSAVKLYKCIRLSFIDRGFAHPFILIEELTNELLKLEKKSYESVIRVMAHEVNNSLGAVSSTLDVIADSLKTDEDNSLIDVLPSVGASIDRCRHLSEFISNFADMVKLPEPTLRRANINDLINKVEQLTKIECNRRNISLTLHLTPKECYVSIDIIQFEQVLVNIVKNAYEAIGENGEIRIITFDHPLSIRIENNGEEIPEEMRAKLFTPFFTTKENGQGIGLMFIKEVLLNHNCRFDLKSQNGWTKFEIFF